MVDSGGWQRGVEWVKRAKFRREQVKSRSGGGRSKMGIGGGLMELGDRC